MMITNSDRVVDPTQQTCRFYTEGSVLLAHTTISIQLSASIQVTCCIDYYKVFPEEMGGVSLLHV